MAAGAGRSVLVRSKAGPRPADHHAHMGTLSTQLFRFLTPCNPETVWSILASRHPSRGRYYGVPVVSDWEVGSTIIVGSCSGNGPALVGEILATERASLLSYSLGDQPDQPTTYVTWNISA